MRLDDLLFALVAGTMVGVAARALAGRAALWATVLAAVGGCLLGTVVYLDLLGFEPDTPNVDWWHHTWQLATAALCCWAVCALARRLPRMD